jgi:hypothetical protein
VTAQGYEGRLGTSSDIACGKDAKGVDGTICQVGSNGVDILKSSMTSPVSMQVALMCLRFPASA